MKALFLAAYFVVSAGRFAIAQGVPHRSCEAQAGHDCCVIRIQSVFAPGGARSRFEIGRTFPEWEAVDRTDPEYLAGRTSSVTLEGTVEVSDDPNNTDVAPHVSFEDSPYNHYTHDLTFKVTPDESYRSVLGIQEGQPVSHDVLETCPPGCLCSAGCPPGPDGVCRQQPVSKSCDYAPCEAFGPDVPLTTQDLIEVEWESGLGADNDSNACHSTNEAGNTCGFFTAGHQRREVIWNWPTAGDRVHVEGYWVWDRGHPPARSEIHPPRLVAIQRKLPHMLNLATSTGLSGFVLTTRADIFASGDGGAMNNNRAGAPSFVRPVVMSAKDYTFTIQHPLPPPSPR